MRIELQLAPLQRSWPRGLPLWKKERKQTKQQCLRDLRDTQLQGEQQPPKQHLLPHNKLARLISISLLLINNPHLT